ncbi:hypothetical protein HGRIS_011112 [Hohenbuehelia grisea]|uniref:Protein kinase domain-containing protein n=1 Tax=Hohenbuehelia grisea TaxID=104357 RepID=A0ABR3IYY2_9AGAR
MLRLLHPYLRQACATVNSISRLSRRPICSPGDPSVIIPYSESMTSVPLNDNQDGEKFVCDEEPHMMGPPLTPGYMPLDLDQTLSTSKGSLKILRKLGWGKSSSVWLAKWLDGQVVGNYVAVKILTCGESVLAVSEGRFEIHALAAMSQAAESHPGRAYCPTSVAIGSAASPHGKHLCIFLQPYSLSLAAFRAHPAFKHLVTLDLIKSTVRGLLSALDFLHSLGFVHTDVKDDNLLLALQSQPDVITDFLREHPSTTHPPRNEPELSPTPIVTVKSESLPPLGKALDDPVFHLSDFGCAIRTSDITPEMCAMPTPLRAPEIVLGALWLTFGRLAAWR